MAWFIDADKLLVDIETLKKSAWYEFGKKPEQSIAHNWYLSREEAVDKVRELCIKAENVVDAEPVRRGRWVTEWTGETMIVDGVKSELGIVRCSVCGGDQGKENYKYCPHCGAKMDGGET
jgi:hypothetical protein